MKRTRSPASFGLGGQPALQIDELGDAESILGNKLHLRDTAQRLIRRGIVPPEDGRNGWLGRYQAALEEAVVAPERRRATKIVERYKHRDRGR